MHAYICSVVRSIGRHRPDGLGTGKKKKKRPGRLWGTGDWSGGSFEGEGGGGAGDVGGERSTRLSVMLC